MPTNNSTTNTDNNIIYRFEKGSYVSFNSINPHQYDTYKSNTSNQKKAEVYNVILKEAGNEPVIIRSRNLEYSQDEDTVTLLRKQHRYLQCREPPGTLDIN